MANTVECLDVFCLTCGLSPKVPEKNPAAEGEECWGPRDQFCGEDAVTILADNNGERHPYCEEHAAGIEHMFHDGAHSPNWIGEGDDAPAWAS